MAVHFRAGPDVHRRTLDPEEGTVAEPLPRYILSTSAPTMERARRALAALEPLVEISSVDAVLNGAEMAPGWVFLLPDVPAEELERLLVGLGRQEGSWSPVALREHEGELRVVPLSPGFMRPLDELVEGVTNAGPDAAFFSFRYALGILSKIRHDLNNPLTAALAETQLLLMDVKEGTEESQALRTVEQQLHRIRDLVALLNALRPPRD
jgi:signal transduction histidine kinase